MLLWLLLLKRQKLMLPSLFFVVCRCARASAVAEVSHARVRGSFFVFSFFVSTLIFPLSFSLISLSLSLACASCRFRGGEFSGARAWLSQYFFVSAGTWMVRTLTYIFIELNHTHTTPHYWFPHSSPPMLVCYSDVVYLLTNHDFILTSKLNNKEKKSPDYGVSSCWVVYSFRKKILQKCLRFVLKSITTKRRHVLQNRKVKMLKETKIKMCSVQTCVCVCV